MGVRLFPLSTTRVLFASMATVAYFIFFLYRLDKLFMALDPGRLTIIHEKKNSPCWLYELFSASSHSISSKYILNTICTQWEVKQRALNDLKNLFKPFTFYSDVCCLFVGACTPAGNYIDGLTQGASAFKGDSVWRWCRSQSLIKPHLLYSAQKQAGGEKNHISPQP